MIIKQQGRHYAMESSGDKKPILKKPKSSKKFIYVLLPLFVCIGIGSIWFYQNYQEKSKFIETYLGPFESLPSAEVGLVEDIQKKLALYKKKKAELLTFGEDPEDVDYAKRGYSSENFTAQERTLLNDDFDCPPSMIEYDPYLVHLILQSRSLTKNDEVQNWFNLYPVMSNDQIEKLYKILLRERAKLLNIDIRYGGKDLYSAIPLLIKKRQYNLSKEIALALDDKINIVNANLLLGLFDEALRLAEEIQEDSSLGSPICDFNFSLALLLTSNYEKAYVEYKKILIKAREDEEYRKLIKYSIEDLTHYIRYSDYKFDRSFANGILGLHYYYFEEYLPEGEDYQNYMRCFLYSYDKGNKSLVKIAEYISEFIEK